MAGMLIQSLIFSEDCRSITPNLKIEPMNIHPVNRWIETIKQKNMRYLITTIEESPFMTELFTPENNFSQGMIVYDLCELPMSL